MSSHVLSRPGSHGRLLCRTALQFLFSEPVAQFARKNPSNGFDFLLKGKEIKNICFVLPLKFAAHVLKAKCDFLTLTSICKPVMMSHLMSGGKERTRKTERSELTVESRRFDVVQMDGGLMDSACSPERQGRSMNGNSKTSRPVHILGWFKVKSSLF